MTSTGQNRAPARTERARAAQPAQNPAQPDCAAVILAGGQARRLGGADKPALEVAGRSMLAAVVAAASGAGARPLIVVSPPRPGLPAARFVQEDPSGGGPVPALRRGLAEVAEPWLLLLAADLPFLGPGPLGQLRAAAAGREASGGTASGGEASGGAASGGAASGGEASDSAANDSMTGRGAASGGAANGGAANGGGGAVLADTDGRPQWLAGCWHAARLRTALASYQGRSLRGLLGPLDPVLVRCRPEPGQAPPWFDCDTPAALAQAQSWGRPRPDAGR